MPTTLLAVALIPLITALPALGRQPIDPGQLPPTALGGESESDPPASGQRDADTADEAAAPSPRRATGYQRVINLTFPVAGPALYRNDYDAIRGRGSRRHQATDILADKLQRIHAAQAGQVCEITGVGEPMPYYGYVVTVCGDDDLRYRYVHFNNDTPGTDDGGGGVRWAYSPKIRSGARVTRGQWLGYVGDSGNAERVRPHLHFEILDPNLDDPRLARKPYKQGRLNPFNSLESARQRGDHPGRKAR